MRQAFYSVWHPPTVNPYSENNGPRRNVSLGNESQYQHNNAFFQFLSGYILWVNLIRSWQLWVLEIVTLWSKQQNEIAVSWVCCAAHGEDRFVVEQFFWLYKVARLLVVIILYSNSILLSWQASFFQMEFSPKDCHILVCVLFICFRNWSQKLRLLYFHIL